MPLSQTAPARVQSATNQARALELRIQGLTLQQIADQIGVSKARAYQYVSEGLAELNATCVVHAEELRRLTTEQLDQLLAAHMPKALAGDTEAAGVVIRCLDSRTKLFGLVQSQPVAPATSPYDRMTPDELRAEARKLGIYQDNPGEPDPYASVPAATMNSHSTFNGRY
jgi:hypothetical protein